MKILLLGLPFSLVATICLADDFSTECENYWHHWRGPQADGVSPHGDPPVVWSEQENIQWKTEVPGEGHATPIVWGDQVFVVSAVPTDRRVAALAPPAMEPPGGYKTVRPVNFYRFVVMCLDRDTGQMRWQKVACEQVPHEGRHGTNSYASSSPTTDGQRLYVSFGSRGIFCYDLQGRLLWDRDLGDMVTRYGWGEGTSPVIHEDSLIVNWDHEGDSFVVVLDPKTGKTRWRADRNEVSSWVTPRVVEYHGQSQLIVPATRRITSYDLTSGEIIWECGGLTTNVIPCPAVYDDFVICMSGHRGSEARAIKLSSRGDVTDDPRQIVWQLHRDTPYVPSPLLYGEVLYVTKSNVAILTCVNPATGKTLSETVRLPEMDGIYASPVGAAGRVYITSREGTTLVIKNTSALDVLAINKLPEGIDASPAIADRQMFLRGKQHLYCLSAE